LINYNIDFCNDFKQIISVWKTVFGDTEEDILFFLNNCKNKQCLGVYDKERLVSMLFLVDCTFGSLNGKYVYAVATLCEYRNKGLAASLMETAEKLKNDFLWLIPANESLISYYSKLGFEIRLYADEKSGSKICFDEIKDIVEYLYEGCDMVQPVGMVLSDKEFQTGNIK